METFVVCLLPRQSIQFLCGAGVGRFMTTVFVLFILFCLQYIFTERACAFGRAFTSRLDLKKLSTSEMWLNVLLSVKVAPKHINVVSQTFGCIAPRQLSGSSRSTDISPTDCNLARRIPSLRQRAALTPMNEQHLVQDFPSDGEPRDIDALPVVHERSDSARGSSAAGTPSPRYNGGEGEGQGQEYDNYDSDAGNKARNSRPRKPHLQVCSQL